MAYKKKVWRFRNAIEVTEYHSARYGAPGEKRSPKQKATPEQIERINQRNREATCRRKLRANFRENDYFATLTYAKDKRPEDMTAAKADYVRFIRAVRKEYQERGHPLRWIRNIEVGTRNGWHIHLVINRIPDTDVILAKCWRGGRVYSELLYEKGEFRDLAAYITKTPKTDPRLKETSYSTSRNLPVPEPEEKLIVRWDTWPQEPRVDKRTAAVWYIDRESYHEGVNRFGHRYRSYTLLRYRRE